MVELGDSLRYVSDADFDKICKTFDPERDLDKEALRKDLESAFKRYWTVTNSQKGENWEGEKFPNLVATRDRLDCIQKFSKLHADAIEDAYLQGAEYEVEGRAGYQTYDGTPPWLTPILQGLRTTEEAIEKILPGLKRSVKTGEDTDLAFPELIGALMNLFAKYARKKPTVINIGDTYDRCNPTKFQIFATACCTDSRINRSTRPKDFYNKLHKTVGKVRRRAKNNRRNLPGIPN